MDELPEVQLNGITWNHSRGYLPMVATSQRFTETRPGVAIQWEKRSLQEFADYPVDELAERYDLLVIDHPWVGFAARHDVLLPLDEHLPEDFLKDQAEHSVGMSHPSYTIGDHHYALAIDAATPVAAYRQDVFDREGLGVPNTWEDLLDLAGRGRVAFASIEVDATMNFFMICCTLGEDPCAREDEVVSREVGIRGLEMLRELSERCPDAMFQWNPIAVYEQLCDENDLIYSPFGYGYSNYAREGYADSRLVFTDLVAVEEHGPCRTTLGGTGLAISSACTERDVALDYARYVASPRCQRTLYFESGGQPAHAVAWEDEAVNEWTDGFFRRTRPALERAFLRPRYNGYLHFQDHAGGPVREYLREGGDPGDVLGRLNQLYAESLEMRSP